MRARQRAAVALVVTASPLLAAGQGVVELPDTEVVAGHPIRTVLPPDAIRALDRPPAATAAGAGFMAPGELVIGVVAGGAARAYPLAQLDWHEVINDRLGGWPIAVTW